jgi:hypothetical protein
MIDEDECEAVGEMIGRGNRSTRRNMPQCHFIHHRFHETCPGLELGPPLSEGGENCLNYGTVLKGKVLEGETEILRKAQPTGLFVHEETHIM